MNGNLIDMCDYIATLNPNESIALCEKYEYNVDETNPQHISDTMQEICSQDGQSALIKVLNIHPDKQVILDAFNSRSNQSKYNAKGNNCNGCKLAVGGNPTMNEYGRYQSFYSAAGDGTANQGTFQSMISMQTNTILVIGLLVIGGALIYKNFK